jgi:tetratricopeptide (TPR) repeat protein
LFANRICLGNVYRDEAKYDQAFTEYFLASKIAQNISDTSLEASTSNLIASIHNCKGAYDLAEQYATHAIGLVRNSVATTELSDAYEELAVTYTNMDRMLDAAKSYIDAASVLNGMHRDERMFGLALEGLFIFSDETKPVEFVRALYVLCDKEVKFDAKKLPLIDNLYNSIWPITRVTDINDTQVPTVVFCRDDIADHWEAGKRGGGAMQILLGLTLMEIAYRILGGEVDLEVLRPKIVRIVRQTIS